MVCMEARKPRPSPGFGGLVLGLETGSPHAILDGPGAAGFATTGNPDFCTLWTHLGLPALNLPLLTVNGLPLGVPAPRLRC